MSKKHIPSPPIDEAHRQQTFKPIELAERLSLAKLACPNTRERFQWQGRRGFLLGTGRRYRQMLMSPDTAAKILNLPEAAKFVTCSRPHLATSSTAKCAASHLSPPCVSVTAQTDSTSTGSVTTLDVLYCRIHSLSKDLDATGHA